MKRSSIARVSFCSATFQITFNLNRFFKVDPHHPGKMSIICEPAETSLGKGFVRATIDPKTKHQLNFPADYQFHEVLMGTKYAELAERHQNFEVRPDDIWICGYPKTGTIWMQNIVKKLNEKLDLTLPIERAFHEYFEREFFIDEPKSQRMKEYLKHAEGHLERLNQLPSPRVFKSHLPAFLLPKQIWTKKAKVIYMARNPKDTTVSRHHMMKNGVLEWEFSMEETFKLMLDDEIKFSPLPEHVLSFWQLRKLDNVLFFTYEELSADRFAGCKKVSEFLGYNYGDDKLQELADLVEFNNMKKRLIDSPRYKEGSNYSHCRKGQVGGYRNEMSQEWIERFDQWIADRFKNTDFDFSQWI